VSLLDRLQPQGFVTCVQPIENHVMLAGEVHAVYFNISARHASEGQASLGALTNVELSTCGSEFNTQLSVWTRDLQEQIAACDDCGACGNTAVLNILLSAGEYVAVIEGAGGDEEGAYDLRLTCSYQEDNDVSIYQAVTVSFLNGNIDSGDVSVTAHGHTLVGLDGASFDGDGDYVRAYDALITDTYASDGTFTIAFWFTKEE
jgi:hypothetical protein